MYKAIIKNISTPDLATIIHFVIKVLNKFRNKENSGLKLEDLPIRPDSNILKICDELLKEINIADISGDDTKIDSHINALFAILQDRLRTDAPSNKNRGKVLLENLRNS